jgi:uncharacterized protein
MPNRIDAYLVAGGKWHDIDYARLELLKMLAEHEHVRVKVAADYEDVTSISASSFLVSYTCDVRPSDAAQVGLHDWVIGGGRWLALHGTNSALDLPRPNGVEAPRCLPVWADTVGSQFIAHPPIQPYLVELTDPDHWLVAGVEPFETDDELYLSEYPDKAALQPLLHTTWSGDARGFAESDWSVATRGTDQHLVSYLRPLGEGCVLYNTLGHCRGHYDMFPMRDYYPNVDRCSWDRPQYRELLRRGIQWALGQNGMSRNGEGDKS